MRAARFFHGSVGSSDRAHQSGIWRTDDLASYILFNGTQNRVITECTALYDDPVAKRVQTADAYDLCKNIFDNGPAESGQNIIDLSAVFLLGDDPAVHEDSAAASQHSRMLCLKGPLRDLRHGNAHVFSEILQEGSAACRAGFIDYDIRNDPVVKPDGLHVLSADIQNKSGVLQIFGAGPCVCHRLNNMCIRAECLCCQKLSIARGRHTSDLKADSFSGKLFVHLDQALFKDRNGISAIICIERVQDPLFFIEKDKFGRGTAAVHAKITVRIGPCIELSENMLVFVKRMPFQKGLIRLFRCKKRTGQGPAVLHVAPTDQGTDPVNAFVDINGTCCLRSGFRLPGRIPSCIGIRFAGSDSSGSSGIQSCPKRHHEFGLFRDQDFLILQLQLFAKSLNQCGMETQGPSLKDDRRSHCQSLGQSADRLLGDRMQGRQSDILFAHALVQQRLDIRFGIHAAASGNIIDLCSPLRQGFIFLGPDLQKSRNLINEGACTAGTAAVHAHIGDFQPARALIFTEKNNLGVLSAQLDGSLCSGIILHDSQRVCHDLLDKRNAGSVSQRLGSRAGKSNPDSASLRNTLFPMLQQCADTFRQLRMMSCVFTVNDLLI